MPKSHSANRLIRIAITCGDTDGIGAEVVSKALSKLKPKRGIQLVLWRSNKFPVKYLKLIDSCFHRETVNTWPAALELTNFSYKSLIDIKSNFLPPQWVEEAARAAQYGHIDAIATAPLSKSLIKDSGINLIGHTEILKKIAKSKNLYMGFLGEEFNVVLVTGHIPISEVSKALTRERLETAIRLANDFKKHLPKKIATRPIGLLGLNPHAGENGIIGKEEQQKLKTVIENVRQSKILISDPLVPDAAFLPQNWKKYSIYVCPYHDQGLIPFKMIHGQNSGVHVTLGLPFVRTSVDHGTAKDIFGRNKANPNSMLEALQWAIKLCKEKR